MSKGGNGCITRRDFAGGPVIRSQKRGKQRSIMQKSWRKLKMIKSAGYWSLIIRGYSRISFSGNVFSLKKSGLFYSVSGFFLFLLFSRSNSVAQIDPTKCGGHSTFFNQIFPCFQQIAPMEIIIGKEGLSFVAPPPLIYVNGWRDMTLLPKSDICDLWANWKYYHVREHTRSIPYR